MKHTNLPHSTGLRVLTALSVSLLVVALGVPAFGQAPQFPQYPQQYPAQAPPAGVQQPATQPLVPPAQLDNLVAPIALYPDPLLGQVLAASTYPLELVEADQFVQQNGSLHGQDLMNAAREQNWDPSVQALVAFPNVLTLLTSNVRWTTDLGNAFLAQQQDVLTAVQRMRGRAQSNGRLYSNPQQTVSNETQNGQSAVEIEPANPDYIDVPDYNPDYVWGPPADGYYPPLWYPPVQYGFGFDPGIDLGGFFPGWGFGWGGWGAGWGWGCGWFGGGLFVNTGFFNHWGFHGYFGSRFAGGFGAGRLGWEHDPFHRAGVSYANRGVATRFSSSARFAEGRTARATSFSARGNSFAGSRGGSNGGFNGARGGVNNSAAPAGARGSGNGFAGNESAANRGGSAGAGGWQHFGGNASAAPRGYAVPNAGAQSFRGNGGAGLNSAPRSFATPGYSAPRSYGGNSRAYSGGGFSAPRSSGGGGFSGGGAQSGGFSGGHSSGGGGGGHSSGGGSHGGGHR